MLKLNVPLWGKVLLLAAVVSLVSALILSGAGRSSLEATDVRNLALLQRNIQGLIMIGTYFLVFVSTYISYGLFRKHFLRQPKR